MHAKPAYRRTWRRAAVVEPHVLQRLRTVEILEEVAGISIVHTSGSIAALMEWLRTQPRSQWPHVLVIETLPFDDAQQTRNALASLRQAGIKVMVVSSMSPKAAARTLLEFDLDGLITKEDDESTLLDCVDEVLAGEQYTSALAHKAAAPDPRTPDLSPQESKVLDLYVQGQTIAAVATAIGTKEDTARKYLARVKRKYIQLGRVAHSKLDLARLAREDGVLL